MSSNPQWLYNEMKQLGVDYTKVGEVITYDEKMEKLRNIEEETKSIIKLTDLTDKDTVLEIGTGTGEFALAAAKQSKKVIATDISPAMLNFAKEKAKNLGISNIEFQNAGFLTYQHNGEAVDVVVSQLALHHLPDFWKLLALKRIYHSLKEGGKFYLRDTVYSFHTDKYEDFFNNWIEEIKQSAGEEMSLDVQLAIAEEYSTLDWIMEALIKRAGFYIEERQYHQGFLGVYLCSK